MSSGGTGGVPSAPDCTGEFGVPETLLTVAAPLDFSGISITGDERELVFVMDTGNGYATPVITTRASAQGSFPPAEAIGGVAACTTTYGAVDISDDGLRLYHSCSADLATLSEVHLAERSDREEPFEDRGVVASMGSSVAVASDELSIYSSGLGNGPPLVAVRATPGAAFGEASAIPGLEDSALTTPDLSSDGLVLFGRENGELGYYTRETSGSDFTTFTVLGELPDTPGSPVISADCRSLYFVAFNEQGERSVFVMRR